jgi:hypothetical protein
VGGAELGEAELGGLERAERLDLALGGGVVGADDAGGAEGLQCGGDGFVGDGVELGVGGGGAGVLVGIQIFEEEVGEEVRLAQTIQLRAEMIEARGERAEVGQAALLPLADESEAVVDEVAGLVTRATALKEDASLAAFYLISLALGVTIVSRTAASVL